MLKELGFQKGVNLGGWFSQCDYSEDRLNNFITEADFKQIASLGFDHVRIPIDYNVIQNPDGTMRPDGLGRIDAALALCDKYGLKAVLDLHKTPGYSFDAGEKEAGFFESESYQERFYWIWETLAEWFGGMSDRVAFELLNEVTEARYLPAWKRISRECVRRIRFFAPDTIILLGSYNWNSAKTVPELDAPYDDKMVYNFHFYEPHVFTHQGAYWMPELQNTRMAYADCGASEQWFEDFLAPAIEKAEKENCELYCGEFGVIDIVSPEESVKWFRDLHAVFARHGIAHAVWSWKQMDFGLIDARMDGVRDELLKLL